jgi:membrane protease YdiL (CAAX protease family)
VGRWVRTIALLGAFAASVLVRVAVGGPGVAQSVPGSLAFAGCLCVLGLAAGTTLSLTWRDFGWGILGLLLICAPVLITRGLQPSVLHGTAGFPRWAMVVTIVAAAEEYFLRGTLYEAVERTALGLPGAVVLPAVAFAALHVPLYGWHVVPLDLAVGVVLGILRERAGSATAPAIAHVGADLVSWFLR